MPNHSKKNLALWKIVVPGPTSSASFEAVLSSKSESRICQIFMRSLKHAI